MASSDAMKTLLNDDILHKRPMTSINNRTGTSQIKPIRRPLTGHHSRKGILIDLVKFIITFHSSRKNNQLSFYSNIFLFFESTFCSLRFLSQLWPVQNIYGTSQTGLEKYILITCSKYFCYHCQSAFLIFI